MTVITHQDIIHFWFDELTPPQWWHQDATLDALIRERFGVIHTAATRGELSSWRDVGAEGRLAEIIIVDQFSRNMFRGTAQSFAFDSLALILAQEAVRGEHHLALSREQRGFMFLPFMHSESLLIHEMAVRLYRELNDVTQLDFEFKHRRIIERFGRYPHRNAILGRVSTAEERAFLQEADSGF